MEFFLASLDASTQNIKKLVFCDISVLAGYREGGVGAKELGVKN